MKMALPNISLKRDSLEELAAAIAGYGVDAVQWFQGLAAGVPDVEECRRIRRALGAHGLEVDHVGAYVNPVGLSAEQRRAGIEHLTGFCRVARELGVSVLATFSGTVSGGTALEWNPQTHSQASYATFVETMRQVMPVAESEGVTIAIEPFVVTVVKDPDTALRAFEDVGSPNLALAMDVVNFYWPDDVEQPRSNELMSECFEKMKGHIAVVHVKDLSHRDGERPTPGKAKIGGGRLDFEHFAACVRASGYRGRLNVEHLGRPEEEIPEVLAFMRRHFPAS
ncbi:MAG TPA: sugar phosphate isomerase/epimerase family protein [Chloroflexota bacterium]|jgi:sugar phosphate isomerase/epimerase